MNKIFILLDGLRRDFLSPYGYFIQNMPLSEKYLKTFQKLDCYSVSAWTPTVLSSIFSQQMPWEHGVLRPYSHSDKAQLNSKLENVNLQCLPGEKFIVTSNPWLINGDNGFLDKWDKVDISAGSYNYNSADIISEVGTAYLNDNHDKQFSMFLHFMDVHAPYSVGVSDFILESDLEKIKNSSQDYPVDRDGMTTKSEIDFYYNACIRKIDFYLHNILKTLEDLGIWDNTEVYVFADHGQNLEDIHAYAPNVINRHGLLFMEGVRVPMMVHSNHAYNTQVKYSLIDLFQDLKAKDLLLSFIANHHNKVLGGIIDGNNKLMYDYINEEYYFSNLEIDSNEVNNIKFTTARGSGIEELLQKMQKNIDINNVRNKLGGNLMTEKIY